MATPVRVLLPTRGGRGSGPPVEFHHEHRRVNRADQAIEVLADRHRDLTRLVERLDGLIDTAGEPAGVTSTTMSRSKLTRWQSRSRFNLSGRRIVVVAVTSALNTGPRYL